MAAIRRLDQILSSCGYCSRTEARAWISAGRVTCNGSPATRPEQRCDPAKVRIDGEPVEGPDGLLVLFHKPAGATCSHDPEEGTRIYDLLPERWSRRNPPITSIGRLDKDTTGVLLLTDIGQLVQRLTSPKHKFPKIYEVELDRDLTPDIIPLFASGELLLSGEEKPCAPARLEIVSQRHARLEITEGRYHQVKRMFAHHGYTVLSLHRSNFAGFTLDDLKPGEWRFLDPHSTLSPR